MSTGDTWRLGHRPALDGLRGVAVLLVVVAHTGILPLRAAGVVGVTMFFTLSGFLITALLLREQESTGTVNLRSFYARRARRLLPASFVMLAVVGGGSVLLGQSLGWFARETLPVVLYYGNWQRATGDYLGWWSHTWSLAVEEQFYLIWPLAVIALTRFGRHTVIVAALAGVIYAMVARPLLWDAGAGSDRVYYGTDTHMDGLLWGALLAAVMHQRPDGKSRPWLAAACVSGAAAASVMQSDFATFVLAVSVVPPLTVGALWSVAQRGGARWLEWPPLVLAGRRSYGLYLWHYPVFVIGHDRVPTLLLVAIAWLLTVASWRYVEQPFLQPKARTLQEPAVEPVR